LAVIVITIINTAAVPVIATIPTIIQLLHPHASIIALISAATDQLRRFNNYAVCRAQNTIRKTLVI
jgi:hypothetical protein